MFISAPSLFTYCYNRNILGKTHQWHFLLCHSSPDISPRQKHSGLYQENLCHWRRIGHLSVSKNNWLHQSQRIRYISMDQQLSEDKIRNYGPYFLALTLYIKHERLCFTMSKHRQESWKYDVKRTIFDVLRSVWKCGQNCLECFIYFLDGTWTKIESAKKTSIERFSIGVEKTKPAFILTN